MTAGDATMTLLVPAARGPVSTIDQFAAILEQEIWLVTQIDRRRPRWVIALEHEIYRLLRRGNLDTAHGYRISVRVGVWHWQRLTGRIRAL
jgi:hypothetical protein